MRPLLFLVHINDLPLSLNSVPRLFTDDTALCLEFIRELGNFGQSRSKRYKLVDGFEWPNPSLFKK